MFFITRFLYILNIIGQIRIMNHFLGQNTLFWGAHILSDVISGRDWELSGNFPRVALCDFTIRTLSNIQRYSIQCVLMLNMFNEKIFLFLYCWLILVGILTTIDTINWILNTRVASRRIFYFRKFIPSVAVEERYIFLEFSNKMIRADGTMLLRMLSANGGELFTQEVLNILWLNYRKHVQLRQVMSYKRENVSLNSFGSFDSIQTNSNKLNVLEKHRRNKCLTNKNNNEQTSSMFVEKHENNEEILNETVNVELENKEKK
ncbi:unnamed protein product [Meloidogyne enterolobii]|uniref:Uncharacterized protein n=1 Tax=Meloidogyne enterolobii TaxID=390850 RepID=A0ACB0YUD3_MELEN